jgi:hypothetical protein
VFSLTILQSSQLIVNAALDVQNVAPPTRPPSPTLARAAAHPFCCECNFEFQVYSPFELDCKRPASLGLFDIPNISVIDWESLDYSVWATCRSLLLLPPDVVDASMKIPFSKEQQVAHSGSIYCGAHCDIKSLSEKRPGDSDADKTACSSNQALLSPGPPLDAADIEDS